MTQDPQTTSLDDKKRRLKALLAKQGATASQAPLSVGQERLLRLSRLSRDQTHYTVAVAYRLTGPLDMSAVHRAVQRIGERHEILRTTFLRAGDKTIQSIAPVFSGADICHVVDLCGAPRPDLAADAALAEELRRNWNLESGPLWRLTFLRTEPDAHLVVLSMHHIVTDGWSFQIILDELGALYAAFSEGRPDTLNPVRIQYRDYASRQMKVLAQPETEHQRAYWARQMAGTVTALELPGAKGQPQETGRSATNLAFSLDGALGRKLTALAQREQASLFMLALTGFAAMLHRSTGQQDLLVATPVTGRHRALSREVVGYCNNLLPLRIEIGAGASLADLLRTVRQVTLDAYRNQDVPFQDVADLPGLRKIPLSRLLFSVDMPWPPPLALGALVCTPIATETGQADFDLSVSLWETDAGLSGTVRFKTDLFTPATIEAIAGAFRDTLGLLADAPATRLADLPSVGPNIRPHVEAGAAPDGAPDIRPDAAGGAPALPRFALEQRLACIWQEVLDLSSVGIHDSFRDLGASSLSVALLSERILSDFGSEVSITAIFKAATIAGVASLLRSESTAADASPVAPIRTGGTNPPLFLCEGVGVYYPLADRLGPEQPVYCLVRDNLAAYPTVGEIAAGYVEHVQKVRPTGPLVIGGLSFGGLVAFELAQRLRAAGRDVALLALFDTPGPDAYRPKALPGRLAGHGRNLARFGTRYLKRKLARKKRTLLRRLHRPDPQAAVTDKELITSRSQLRKLFRESAGDYAFEPYDGRIVLFQLAQRDALSDSLFDPELGRIDPLLGWGSVARHPVENHRMEGDHIGLLREPHVERLASLLAERIRRASPPAPDRGMSRPTGTGEAQG